MKILIFLLLPLVISSCTSVNEGNNYGFYPSPGMSEDAQGFNNTKYNLMDSSDGQQDPNAYYNIWRAKY